MAFASGSPNSPPPMYGMPNTDKYSMLLEDDKVVVGASSMQGWRNSMEDAHTVFLTLPRLNDAHEEDGAIFAVFDGHCGSRCAQLCSTNIVHWLCQSEHYAQGNYAKGLLEAFVRGDEALRSTLGKDESGCTAVVVLLIKKTLYFASAGDSRAILCRKGKALPLTEDHKPTLPAEKARIDKSGGFVANGRVNGVLALSRAFGDFPMKDSNLAPQDQAVTVVPDVGSVELGPDDEFVAVACDGLFEKKNNDELIEYVRNQLEDYDDVSVVCEKLMMDGLGPSPTMKGSDNMSVIVVRFKDALCGSGFTNETITRVAAGEEGDGGTTAEVAVGEHDVEGGELDT